MDIDDNDWDSDVSEESSDVSSFSVEGAPVILPVVVGNSALVAAEDEMIAESVGTFEIVPVTFSVSQPIWSSDGTLVSVGFKGRYCTRVIGDLKAGEYLSEIAFCTRSGCPLPNPRDRPDEFEATFGHGSLLPTHPFRGLPNGPGMFTVPSTSDPSLSVSESELDSHCAILVRSNGGESSSSDSDPSSNSESLLRKLHKDAVFLACVRAYWFWFIPNCGAESFIAMWMSSGT